MDKAKVPAGALRLSSGPRDLPKSTTQTRNCHYQSQDGELFTAWASAGRASIKCPHSVTAQPL